MSVQMWFTDNQFWAFGNCRLLAVLSLKQRRIITICNTLQMLGKSGQKMREMQADFAQKIGELMKQKEDLEKEVLAVTVSNDFFTLKRSLLH